MWTLTYREPFIFVSVAIQNVDATYSFRLYLYFTFWCYVIAYKFSNERKIIPFNTISTINPQRSRFVQTIAGCLIQNNIVNLVT